MSDKVRGLFFLSGRTLVIIKNSLLQIAFGSGESRTPGNINADQNDDDQENSGDYQENFLILIQFELL